MVPCSSVWSRRKLNRSVPILLAVMRREDRTPCAMMR